MQELRSWMMGISVTLIITGIIVKLIPGNANKAILNFVVTMVIIASIFGVDTSEINAIFEFEFTTEAYTHSVLTDELYGKIERTINEGIKDEIKEIVSVYDSDASVEIELDHEVMQIRIISVNLSNNQKTAIENEIRRNFDGAIHFVYGGEISD